MEGNVEPLCHVQLWALCQSYSRHGVDEDFVTYYKPSEEERASANEDKFAEKILTCTVESRMKLVEDFRMIRPKMTSYVMQSITEAGEKTLKER